MSTNTNTDTNTNVVSIAKPTHDFGLLKSGCDFPVHLIAPHFVSPYKDASTLADLIPCADHRLIVGFPILKGTPNETPHEMPVVYAAVKKGYGLINHRDVFSHIEDSIRNAINSRTLSTCKVHDMSGYLGRDWCRRYVIEGLSANPDNKSPICFTIYARHSYGAGAMKVMFGETRLSCLNGAVVTAYECIYRRHSSGFTIDRLPEVFKYLDRYIAQFSSRMRYLEIMGKNVIDMTKVEQYLLDSDFSERRAKVMYETFVAQMLKESNGIITDVTVLQLYHFLTYYASHNVAHAAVRKTEQDNVQMTLLKRQVEVGALELETMFAKTRRA